MNRQVLVVLCLAVFASTLGQGLVVPLLPVYASSLGASGFFIGLIFGMFSISRSIFLPYFGQLSDINGRKPFITWGMFFYFCASIAFICSTGVISLIVIRFFQGISSAMILPVAQAYAAEITLSGKEGRIMGLMNVSVFAGLSAGPIMGGVINDYFGIRYSFGSMGAVCLLGLLLCVKYLPGVRFESGTGQQAKPLSLLALTKNATVAGVFLVRFGYILCMGSLWAFLPLIAVKDYALSSSAAGVMMSLVVFISAVLSVPVGILADRISSRLLVFLGGVLTLCGIGILLCTNSGRDLYLVAALVGIGGGFITPASTAMSAVIGKTLHSVGSVMSLLTMGQSLGMFAGPLITGLIMDNGDSKTAFMVSGFLFLILLIGSLFLTRNYEELLEP